MEKMGDLFFCKNSSVTFDAESTNGSKFGEPLVEIKRSDPSVMKHENPSKKCYFLLTKLLIILSTITVLATLTLVLSEKSEELKPSSEAQKTNSSSLWSNRVVFVDFNQIKIYDLETKKLSIFKKVENEIVLFEAGNNENFYWVEKNSLVIQSFSQNSSENVSLTEKLKPQAMAFDHLTEKFYIIDKSAETVSVLDKEGKSGIILSNIEEPHDIVVDVEVGVMFVTQHLRSIVRANLDGSNRIEIIPDCKVAAITIDRKEKKIFWTDEVNGISSANYEGKNLAFLAEPIPRIKSIAFFENKLFWLLPGYLKHDASMWSCELSDKKCINLKKLPFPLKKPAALKFTREVSDEVDNPCRENNGNCSDLCLLVPGNKRSCACQVKYQLNSDSQSCRYITEFLLYVERNYVKGMHLDVKPKEGVPPSRDSFFPTLLFEKSSAGVVDFEFDLVNDDLYYTDGKKIYKTSFLVHTEATPLDVRIAAGASYSIENLTFDSLRKNLYFLVKMIDTNNNYSVTFIYSIKVGETIELKKSKLLSENEFNCTSSSSSSTSSLSIDVHKGKLFCASCGYSSKSIYLMNLDVSNVGEVSECTNQEVMAVDYNQRKIYFLNVIQNTMTYRDFDRLNTSLQVDYRLPEMDKAVNYMQVFKDHLYMGNSWKIWRLNKVTGAYAGNLVSKSNNQREKKISGVKIYAVQRSLRRK